ncbi:MAG: EF-hand domain-containing protein [Alphaproteobacteria bacterium]|jgi:hypothetical protein|nr:EF-hand domain-containing protein [Alphaproteobacteria bacterium]
MLKQKNILVYLIAAAAGAFLCPQHGAAAGLDLENQTQIPIDALDLDADGRITRTEVAKYMFYYFDRDGNESVTKNEYHAERPIDVLPKQNPAITFIDLDNDGQDDGVEYNKDSFLEAVMVGEYAPGSTEIKALNVLDIYFLRADTDESRAIELSEWQKIYAKHSVKKGNAPPEAANQDHYAK